MRYRFMQTQAGIHCVVRLCAALDVSRSGYYAWRRRPESARQQANRVLVAALRDAHQRSKARYGAVKLWHTVVASGIACGRHRVARLCRVHGLETRRMRRFRHVIEQHHQLPPPAPNRLQQHFIAPSECPFSLFFSSLWQLPA